jgi:hypothetical protein
MSKKEAVNGTPVLSEAVTGPVTPVEPRLLDSIVSKQRFEPLPDPVYRMLPPHVEAITGQMKPGHTRDLFLTGILPVLGGMMPNVLMSYGGEWLAPNLFTCILAPTGAGKGGLMRARRIGDTLHKRLHQESRDNRREYYQTPAEDRTTPEPPPFRLFFAPADASSAGLKALLADSPHAVMFTTEAKTLGAALASDWGNFRDVILKAYQNEPIEVLRKFQEPTYIPKPALGMIISGTPGSFEGILTDTEDGLYSRFMFYYFETSNDEFGNMFASREQEAIEADIEDMATRLSMLYPALDTRDVPLFITMSQEDQARVIQAGQKALTIVRKTADPNLVSNVRRAALNAFRIAAIFTVTDDFLNGIDVTIPKSLECKPRYVRAGISLAFAYLEHALRLSDAMNEGLQHIAGHHSRFVHALPDGDFTTAQAETLAKEFKTSARSIRAWLAEAVKRGQIQQVSKGNYHKTSAERTYVSLRTVAELAVK